MSTSAAASATALAQLAARIDAALPQTQCTRCGYPDCKAYAHAVADGHADINQCPPGGAEGVARLAIITGRPATPLNAEHGHEGVRVLAVIDEGWCIGCTLCIKACPTDAILGANKRMHTVIAPHCTGCELCIPVCPVDCISLTNASGQATGWAAWSAGQAEQARSRYTARQMRLQRDEEESRAPLAPPVASSDVAADGGVVPAADAKQAAIAAAMARARERRAQT